MPCRSAISCAHLHERLGRAVVARHLSETLGNGLPLGDRHPGVEARHATAGTSVAITVTCSRRARRSFSGGCVCRSGYDQLARRRADDQPFDGSWRRLPSRKRCMAPSTQLAGLPRGNRRGPPCGRPRERPAPPHEQHTLHSGRLPPAAGSHRARRGNPGERRAGHGATQLRSTAASASVSVGSAGRTRTSSGVSIAWRRRMGERKRERHGER
jgi:hypothetical protein